MDCENKNECMDNTILEKNIFGLVKHIVYAWLYGTSNCLARLFGIRKYLCY